MSNLGARGGRLVTRADNNKAAVARSGSKPDGLARAGRRPAPKLVQVRLDDPDQRRGVVLRAAVALTKKDPQAGLMSLTWDAVAAACEVKTAGITARRMFKKLIDLRNAVVEHGRSNNDPVIIDQGQRFGFLN